MDILISKLPAVGWAVDNLEQSIYAMLNEIAGRHALRPCEFRAEFRDDEVHMCHRLTFTWPGVDNEDMLRRYRTMLRNIGINPNEGQELRGSAEAIYNALERALVVVPKRSDRAR